MTESSRREKDLPMTEEFEYVRGIDPNGRSVNVPKSLFGGNLDVASEEVLGGVKASPKSETDTNEVKIDPETGKLYCPPSEVSMATAEKIGGIVADVKTSEETEEVKIDPNTGKAYVKPSSKIGIAESDKLGGIMASEKTEGYTTEVKIDPQTGKLYVPKGEGTPPDNEDITVSSIDGSNALRFKDRDASKGMGYVILRTNKTIAEQFAQSNTIYEIRYDFDLGGETLQIPANCVLDFKGGSFNNGTLVGNNTSINAGVCKIFHTDIVIDGTWNVTEAYAEWFGAVGDGTTDDRPAIQKTLDSFNTTMLLNRNYRLLSYTKDHTCLILPDHRTLKGIKREDTSDAFTKANISVGSRSVMTAVDIIVLSVGSHTAIENIGIGGNCNPLLFEPDSNRCVGITHNTTNNYRIRMSNVDIRSCYYGLNMSCWMSSFEFVVCKYCAYGIVLHGIINSNPNGVWDIYTNSSPTYNSVITSLNVRNCYCNDCFLGGYYFTKLTYSSVFSCAADGCGFFNRNTWAGEYNTSYEQVTSSNTKWAYNIIDCIATKFFGLGTEGCMRDLYTYRNRGINVENCHFILNDTYFQFNSDEPISITNRLNFSLDRYLTIKNITFSIPEANFNKQIANCVGGMINATKVSFENLYRSGYGFLPKECLYSHDHLEGSIIEYKNMDDAYDLVITSATFPNETSDKLYSGYTQLKSLMDKYFEPHTNKVFAKRKVVFKFSDLTSSDGTTISGSITGNGGSLHIIGDTPDWDTSVNLYTASNLGATIENFDSITFENVYFYINGSTTATSIDYFLKFVNCRNVYFKNCKFDRGSTVTVSKFFQAEGSTLVFDECSDPDSVGKTANRPVLVATDKGKTYFDTTLGKLILWDGTSWINTDGSSF